MIGFLISVLSLLISPVGMFVFLLGMVSFFLLPFIPRATNHFHAFARFHQRLAGMILKRAAIVVSEHGDLLLKRMSPDDTGVEKIAFNEDTKEFEDPHESSSWWLGMRFALANEAHGFLFDPIDAALGRRKREAEQDDEMVVKATEKENRMYDVQGWVRGVFEFPEGVHEIVNLCDVKYLVTGSERAEHPQKVRSFYENSREPYEDGPSASRLFMILAALIGPFAMIWILSSQLGGPSNTVSFGMLLLLLSTSGLPDYINGKITKDRLKEWGKIVAVIVPVPLIFLLVAVLITPMYAIALLVVGLLGFFLVPILSQVIKVSDDAAASIAKLLLKLGFVGYDTPILKLTPSGYKTVEYNNLEKVDEDTITWHSFLGRKFGFTFEPYPEMWGNEVVDADDLEDRTIDEDTNPAPTNISSGFQRIPERTRAVYGDFVPSRLKKSHYYVSVGIALERFAHVAVGQKSHIRLTQAKEEFGGGNGLEDRTVAYLMVGIGTISLFAGIAVFLLPAFL